MKKVMPLLLSLVVWGWAGAQNVDQLAYDYVFNPARVAPRVTTGQVWWDLWGLWWHQYALFSSGVLYTPPLLPGLVMLGLLKDYPQLMGLYAPALAANYFADWDYRLAMDVMKQEVINAIPFVDPYRRMEYLNALRNPLWLHLYLITDLDFWNGNWKIFGFRSIVPPSETVRRQQLFMAILLQRGWGGDLNSWFNFVRQYPMPRFGW